VILQSYIVFKLATYQRNACQRAANWTPCWHSNLPAHRQHAARQGSSEALFEQLLKKQTSKAEFTIDLPLVCLK